MTETIPVAKRVHVVVGLDRRTLEVLQVLVAAAGFVAGYAAVRWVTR